MKFIYTLLLFVLYFTFLNADIITSTAISPEENIIVMGTSDGRIYIYDVFLPNIIYKKEHIGAVTDIEFASQKKQFLSVGLGGNLFKWRMNGDVIIQRPTHIDERLYSVSITPGEAEYFLYGGYKGDIYYCDYNSFNLINIYKTNNYAISNIRYSQHYNDEFIVCHFNSIFERRDVVSKNDVLVTSKKRSVVTDVIYTVDNSKYIIGYDNGIVEVYNKRTNKRTAYFSDCESTISDLDITDDNSYLLASCEDSTAVLWDLDLRKKLFVFPNHNGRVMGAYFLNSNLIVTVADTKTIHFWDRGSLSQKGYLIFNEDSFCYLLNDKYELFGKQVNLKGFPIINDLIDYKEHKELFGQIITVQR